MTVYQRIALLLSQKSILSPWVGDYDEKSLLAFIDSEIGDHRRLESWVSGSRVIPRSPILHVLSGNTEHAAFQSLFRAFLIGCPRNFVKIPSSGLPFFEAWIADIPYIELSRDLSDAWRNPELAVIYGDADTLNFFHEWLLPGTRIIPHGPKVSAAFVFSDEQDTVSNLATDILSHNQRGCLSLQMIYYKGDEIEAFCVRLAAAMEKYLLENPSTPHTLSEAGQILNIRETTTFRIANGEPLKIWHSKDSPAYTVILDSNDINLRPTATGGLVRVCPMPEIISSQTLGVEIHHLSTAICQPISAAYLLDSIQPPRICLPGQAQHPPLTWHPDGEQALAPMLKWRDLQIM